MSRAASRAGTVASYAGSSGGNNPGGGAPSPCSEVSGGGSFWGGGSYGNSPTTDPDTSSLERSNRGSSFSGSDSRMVKVMDGWMGGWVGGHSRCRKKTRLRLNVSFCFIVFLVLFRVSWFCFAAMREGMCYFVSGCLLVCMFVCMSAVVSMGVALYERDEHSGRVT